MRKNVLVAGVVVAAVVGLMVGSTDAAQEQANPRQQPDASITMFAPDPAADVNPATPQIDFSIRSPQQNPRTQSG
jgi:hypothetical protein